MKIVTIKNKQTNGKGKLITLFFQTFWEKILKIKKFNIVLNS